MTGKKFAGLLKLFKAPVVFLMFWTVVLPLPPVQGAPFSQVDLIYEPGDLEFKIPTSPERLTPTDLEGELSQLLGRNAFLLQLLKINIKDEKKLIDQIVELDKQFKFINLDSIRRFEKRINLRAWTNLYSGIQGLRSKRLDTRSLESIQTATEEYRKLIDLANQSNDTAKAGKYAFFLALIQDELARMETDNKRRREKLDQAKQQYLSAYENLKSATEKNPVFTSDDALEKIYQIDQDFGGVLPLIPPAGREVYLVSDIGMRVHPIKNRRMMHKGIDLANSGCNGWRVQAIGPGRVVKSGWEKGYGYVIVILHGMNGQRVFARYAHLRKDGRIAEGTVISRGTAVGACNNTGLTTGPHLHFELLSGGEFGKPIDPKPFIPRLKTAGGK